MKEVVKEDEREPLSMGGASIIIIFTTFVMSVIIVFMIAAAYENYKANQDYIAHTQAYYVADGEAATKRALVEEQLYKLYFSKAEIKYDMPHILKVIKNIKDIEMIEEGENLLILRYEEPINKEEYLVVELTVQPIKKGLEPERFTKVNKWQVEQRTY